MTVQAMRAGKSKKNFYRNCFRNVVWFAMGSIILNIALILGIYQKLVNVVEPSYYATSGVKPPIQLKGLSHPNYSSTALLPPDPIDDANESTLTQ